ncbi:hypothetical protein ABTE19_21795, partial [Acinetobacter baumannii]
HDCMAIAGAVEAFPVMAFSTSWSRWVDTAEIEARYARVVEAARGDLPELIAEIALIVGHAARKSRDGMRFHLKRAFAMGASAAK